VRIQLGLDIDGRKIPKALLGEAHGSCGRYKWKMARDEERMLLRKVRMVVL
jgi:hypothetical protein